MSEPAHDRWLLVSRIDQSERLRADLERFGAGFQEHVAPGVLAVPDDVRWRRLPLARQAMPDAACFDDGLSINRWARAVLDRMLAFGEFDARPWRLHTAVVGEATSPSRTDLIAETLDGLLRKRRRSWRRTRTSDPMAPYAPDEVVVQLVLWRAGAGAISIAPAPSVARWPGGLVEVPVDKRPPSRAYRKLLEAEIRFDERVASGQRCVDLGAAPGGWSHVVLERGASLVAVDRSPLRADLMRHGKLEFVQGDAFQYTPASPVDWLLCDVAATPDRNLELFVDWLRRGWCRRALVTLKLKGDERDAVFADARRELDALEADGVAASTALRQLDANHNEVTLWCRAAS